MISYDEALQQIFDAVVPLGTERVALDDAHTRVLSRQVVSQFDLPLFDNSAVDGYAVRAEETPGTLKLVGTVPAGEAADFELQPGTTVKVMTGAPVPRGADAVVMREDVEGTATFKDGIELGANIRRQGEEISVGDTLFEAGTSCTPPVVALLASAGVSEVSVFKRPTVGVLVTGDELVTPGEELKPGHIYESNGIALKTALAEIGIDARVERTKDDLGSTIKAVKELAKQCDVLITTGGVSVGDFDVVRKALESIGAQEKFWRVSMKPGKPICFSVVDPSSEMRTRYVFGLPGNPVSVLVTFSLFVVPALLAMQGTAQTMNEESGTLAHDWKHHTGRLEFARAFVTRNGNGASVSLEKCQASHMLSGLANANALAILDADEESFAKGEIVDIRELPWRTKR